MNCGKCGRDNDQSATICSHCGAPLPYVCSNCAAPLVGSDRFCRQCGQPVPATEYDDEQLAHLNASAPTDLIEKIETFHTTSDYKVVTSLFATLVVSGETADSLKPETSLAIHEGALELLSPHIYRYEGTIARLLGDGLLAFFGAPLTHEDDPQRAVYAALDLLNTARDYAEEVRRQYAVDFAVRIGVNTGLVVVGKVDSALKYDYTATGDTVSLAAQLQDAAPPMTMLVSQETFRYVQAFFESVDLGSTPVGDAGKPLQVYQIIQPKTGIIRARGIVGLESVFVGRAGELATLRQLSIAVQAGLGRVALLLGEPGLGKSRLLSEWRAGQNLRWVEGQCQSFAQGFPYQLVTALLRSLLGVGDGEADAALREQTERLFGAAELEVYPYLASLLGIALEGVAAERIQQLDPQSLAMQYADAFRRFLSATTAQSPLAIICEDIHWADSSSVELLIKILPIIPVTRVMFCFTSRPDRNVSGWRIVQAAREILGDSLTEIQLKPLSDADSQQLLSTLLSTNALSTQVMAAVRGKAEGNPFFVEELVRTLIENGTIRREGDQWVSEKTFTSAHVPDNLMGLLLARIDHQPEHVKRALRVASVIGRQFSVRLLQHILAIEETTVLMTRLSTLEAASLIQLAQVEPELEYRFRHALLQEASYTSLLPDDCRQLHLAVGQALETLYPDRLHELAATLGHHFMEAGENTEANKYFLLAAEYASRMYANAEAIAHYSHVLELIEQSDSENYSVLRERGALYERVGDFDASRADREAALAYVQQAGDRSGEWQALIDLGFLWLSRDYAQSGVYFQRAYELAQILEEPKLIATALNRLGNWHMNLEESHLALEFHEQALKLFEEQGDRKGILETVDLLSMAEMMTGDFITAQRYADQALVLAEELDNKRLSAYALVMTALVSSYIDVAVSTPFRPLAEKVARIEKALQIARSTGWRSDEAFFTGMYGLMLGHAGNYAQGLNLAEEGLTIAREINHDQWQINAATSASQIYLEMCAPARAQEYAEIALEKAKKIGSVYWMLCVISCLAGAYVRLGEFERAETLLNDSIDLSSPPSSWAMRLVWMSRILLELARERFEEALRLLDILLVATPGLDERGEQGILIMSLARSKALAGLMRMGKGAPSDLAPQAEAALRAAETLAEGHHLLPTLWRVNAALGELYRFLLRPEEAEQEFAKARAIVEKIAATAPNDELRAQLLRGAAEEWSNMRADLAHRVVKGYQIRETISSGGFGVVYRAYQPVVDREVAVKVILPQHANQADFVQRFEAEAHLVARLEHPHIVPLYDYWRDADGAFLVMRFIRGGSLREALANGTLPLDFVARMAEQVAAALAAAHRQGVIHRDIKPDNILLDEDGNAYLTDFGIAKIGGLTRITGDEGIAGSLYYISPEQITGDNVSPQTDIYGLGVVLYEALAGQHPFSDVNLSEMIFKHLQEPLPDVRAARPDLPAAVNDILQKATRKNPAERYMTAPDFAQALRAALPAESTLPPPPRNENPLLTRRITEEDTATQIGFARPNDDAPQSDAPTR